MAAESPPLPPPPADGGRRAAAAIAILLGALFLWHWRVVCRTAVDVPYQDEWEVFRPGGLSSRLSARWLWSQDNDFRSIPTSLQIWALYRLDGWNLSHHVALDFPVYGLVLACLFAYLRDAAPALDGALLACFLPFLLSPRGWEIHVYGQHSELLIPWLCLLACCAVWFSEGRSRRRWAGAGAAAVVAIFGHGFGLVAVLAALAARWAMSLSGPDPDRRALLATTGAIAAAALAWRLGWRRPPHLRLWAMPWTRGFWTFFLELIGSGFGFDRHGLAAGLAALLALLAPLALSARRARAGRRPGWWKVASLAAALLAVCAAVTTTRALNVEDAARDSRYLVFTTPLALAAAAAWGLALEGGRRAAAAAAGLWLFAFAGFFHRWDFSVYDRIAQDKLRGLECIARHWRGQGPDLCPTIYPGPLGERLTRARELRVSFARELGR